MKEIIRCQDVPDIDFGHISRTTQLGIFDFRAFLNLAMLVSESERAKLLCQAILDIVIDTINQRDEDFLHSAFVEENYRKLPGLKDSLRINISSLVLCI